MLKRCSKCKEFKDATLEYFAPNKRHTDGLTSWCKKCNIVKERQKLKSKGKRIA